MIRATYPLQPPTSKPAAGKKGSAKASSKKTKEELEAEAAVAAAAVLAECKGSQRWHRWLNASTGAPTTLMVCCSVYNSLHCAAKEAAEAEATRVAEAERQRVLEEAAKARAEEVARLTGESAWEIAAAKASSSMLTDYDTEAREREAWERHQDCATTPSFTLDSRAALREWGSFFTRMAEEDALVLSALDEGTITLLGSAATPALNGASAAGRGDGGASSATVAASAARLRRSASSTHVTGTPMGVSPNGGGGPPSRLRNAFAGGGGGGQGETSIMFGGQGLSNTTIGGAVADQPLQPRQAQQQQWEHRLAASALSPGLEYCSELTRASALLESTALPDALEEGNDGLAAIIRGYIDAARDAISARVDVLTSAALTNSAQFASDIKDGTSEMHLSDVFFDHHHQQQQQQHEDAGIASPVIAGEVLLWANLGPGKVNRLKTVKSKPYVLPFGERAKPQQLLLDELGASVAVDSSAAMAAGTSCGAAASAATAVRISSSGAVIGAVSGDAHSNGATQSTTTTTTSSSVNAHAAAAPNSSPAGSCSSGVNVRPPSRPGAAGHGGPGASASINNAAAAAAAVAAIAAAPAAKGGVGWSDASAALSSKHSLSTPLSSVITVDLHKTIASLPAALRVTATAYDAVAANAARLAAEARAVLKEASARAGPARKSFTKAVSGTGASSAAANGGGGGGGGGAVGPRGSAMRNSNSSGAPSSSALQGSHRAPSSANSFSAEQQQQQQQFSDQSVSGAAISTADGYAAEGTASSTGGGDASSVTSVVPAPPPQQLQLPPLSPLKPVGPIITVELLALPSHPVMVKGLALTRLTPALTPSHSVSRMPHPAEGQGGAAAAQAFKVRFRIPSSVIIPSKLVVGKWTPTPTSSSSPPTASGGSSSRSAEGSGEWSSSGIADVSFDPLTRVLCFSSSGTCAHALVQPRHCDIPFSSWSLRPTHLRKQSHSAGLSRETSTRVTTPASPWSGAFGIDESELATTTAAVVSSDGDALTELEEADEAPSAPGSGVPSTTTTTVAAKVALRCTPHNMDNTTPSAMLLSLVTPRYTVEIHVEGGECALLAPRIPELAHLLQPAGDVHHSRNPRFGSSNAAQGSQPINISSGGHGAAEAAAAAAPTSGAASSSGTSRGADGVWMRPARLLFELRKSGIWIMPEVSVEACIVYVLLCASEFA